VGQDVVGERRRQLAGLLELLAELRRGVGEELRHLLPGLVAAGGAEHRDQDRQAERTADLLHHVEQAGGRARLLP
jgi:hypothetical protein